MTLSAVSLWSCRQFVYGVGGGGGGGGGGGAGAGGGRGWISIFSVFARNLSSGNLNTLQSVSIYRAIISDTCAC